MGPFGYPRRYGNAFLDRVTAYQWTVFEKSLQGLQGPLLLVMHAICVHFSSFDSIANDWTRNANRMHTKKQRPLQSWRLFRIPVICHAVTLSRKAIRIFLG